MREQANHSRKQIAAVQFKDAIEHLGDEKQAVVLGGGTGSIPSLMTA